MPGILALDVHSSDTSKILTGGNDRNATVFNKDTEQVVAILKGHTKKVTKVIYHPDEDLVITGRDKNTFYLLGLCYNNEFVKHLFIHLLCPTFTFVNSLFSTKFKVSEYFSSHVAFRLYCLLF